MNALQPSQSTDPIDRVKQSKSALRGTKTSLSIAVSLLKSDRVDALLHVPDIF